MLDTLQSWLIELGLAVTMAVLALYLYFKISYSYWERRGVSTVKPTAPFGNFRGSIISGENPAFEMVKLYNAFKGQKIGGLYKLSGPSLLLLDTDIIKDVLVKDFDHFFSRGRFFDDEFEPLDGHLFSLSGTKWRNLRVKLTPIFTTKKMKMMFGAVVECGRDLRESLRKCANSGETVEIHDFLARYSTDVISSCAFGIQCNCLKNPEAEFRQWGRRIFEPHFRQRMTSLLQIVYPSLVYTFKLSLVPREVSNYFQRMVKETVEYRESNNVERNDFMQLMIQLKNKTLSVAEEEDLKSLEKQTAGLKNSTPFEITMNVIAAQAFVFFIAGFETSSNTMAFCLYELAMHPEMQDRVRADIDTVLQKHGGHITYEAITEMEYLDKVVSETLRKYPAVPAVTRECTKSIKLRGTDVTVEKGTQVLLPILALHHDPKYYPDPERFDPERFSEEGKKTRPQFSYIPFGEGPRLCIGMRFAMMQVKVGLINVLSNYEVQKCDKTPASAVFETRGVLLRSKGGMWLKIVNRK